MFSFQLTSYGQTLLATSGAPQTLTFVIGSAYNYVPTISDTGIHGTQITQGTTSPAQVQQGIPTYAVAFNGNLASQGFGEIGLFNGTNLVALGVDVNLNPVYSGNVSIDCQLSSVSTLNQSVANLAGAGVILYQPSADALPQAQIANPNMFALSGTQLLAITMPGSNQWGMVGGTDLGVLATTAISTTSVQFPSTNSTPVNGVLYVSFLSGANKGFFRQGTVAANTGSSITLNFATSLNFPVAATETIQVYGPAVNSNTLTNLLPANAYNPSAVTITGGTINGVPVGAGTPSTGVFTNLQATGNTVLAGLVATSLNNTPIGNTTPSSGSFTTLVSTGALQANSLAVVNNASLGGTLTVAQATTLSGATSVNAPLTVGGTFTASGNAVVGVNSSETLLVNSTLNAAGPATFSGALSAAQLVATGGTINGVPVGATTPSTGAFTTLAATGATVLQATNALSLATPSATITGGTVDGTAIGATTPSTGSFTNVIVGNSITVPTQLVSDNSTKAANTAYTTSKVNAATVTIGSTVVPVNGAASAALNGVTIGLSSPASAQFTSVSSTGAVQGQSLSVTGAATVGGTLSVTGPSSFTGALSAVNAALTGTLSVTGAATFSGTQDTAGLASFTGGISTSGGPTTLGAASTDVVTVNGTATFAQPLTVSNNLTVAGNVVVNGNTTLGNAVGDTLSVPSTATFSGPATFSGATTLANAAINGGAVNATPIGATTASTGRFTTLNTTGAASVQSLAVSGNSVLSGTLTVTGSSSFTSAITAQGGLNTTSLVATGGTIDATPIGASTPSTGSFSVLNVTGALTAAALTSATVSTGGLTATGGTIDGTVIGGTTASSGAFTNLTATGTTNLGVTVATSINSTPIGASVPSSGAFTTLSASGVVSFAGGINSTTIGGSTPAAGTFTGLTSTGAAALNSLTVAGTTALAGLAVASNFASPNATITGGTLDGSIVGGTTPSTGTFTNLNVNTALNLSGTVSFGVVTANSATAGAASALPATPAGYGIMSFLGTPMKVAFYNI